MANYRLASILLCLELVLSSIGFAQSPAGAPAHSTAPEHSVPAHSMPAHPVPAHPVPAHPMAAKPAVPQPKAQTTASAKPTAAPASKATAATAKPTHPPTAEPVKPEPPKEAAAKEAAKVGSVTGLPLPRFAALRSDDVNLRVGPGTRYPISWVYKRRELPVQIEREYEVWRLVKDPEGNLGWVHQANLVGRRTFVLRGETRAMRRSADDNSAAVAVLKPGVVGRLVNCAADAQWCEVQVGEYRGYLRRDTFWGTFAGEPVN